jgi:hypothetical protein
LIVNEETPMSYLPDCTAGIISPNLLATHSVLRWTLAAVGANADLAVLLEAGERGRG